MNTGQKRDYQKFFIEKGDPDFSPEHNKAVVENSIKKYEAKRKKIVGEFRDAVMERSDALITYIRAIDRGGVNKNLDGFFTRDQIAKLQGRDLQAKIMEGLTIIHNKKKIQNAEKNINASGRRHDTRLTFKQLCKVAGISARQRLIISRYIRREVNITK